MDTNNSPIVANYVFCSAWSKHESKNKIPFGPKLNAKVDFYNTPPCRIQDKWMPAKEPLI